MSDEPRQAEIRGVVFFLLEGYGAFISRTAFHVMWTLCVAFTDRDYFWSSRIFVDSLCMRAKVIIKSSVFYFKIWEWRKHSI